MLIKCLGGCNALVNHTTYIYTSSSSIAHGIKRGKGNTINNKMMCDMIATIVSKRDIYPIVRETICIALRRWIDILLDGTDNTDSKI